MRPAHIALGVRSEKHLGLEARLPARVSALFAEDTLRRVFLLDERPMEGQIN
jgi:hypothetical protein